MNLEMWHRRANAHLQKKGLPKQAKEWEHGCNDCAIAGECHYWQEGGGNDVCWKREKPPGKKRAAEPASETDCDSQEYRQTLQQICRRAAKVKLLQDIKADMAVCEIEGWDKLEYVRDLKDLMEWLLRREGRKNEKVHSAAE